jgi:hypothetical protein
MVSTEIARSTASGTEAPAAASPCPRSGTTGRPPIVVATAAPRARSGSVHLQGIAHRVATVDEVFPAGIETRVVV